MSRGTAPRTAPGPLRLGWARGLVEFRQSFTSGPDLASHLVWPLLMLVALWYLREREFDGTDFALGTLALPGILGMNIALGLLTMSQLLTADREDGTLLRARAVPHGMRAYLTGKVVTVAGTLLADLLILLVPGTLLIDGLAVGGAGAWLTLAWVLPLGMAATLPAGAVLGALFTSTRAQGLIQIPVLAVIGISGVFYPLSALPGWTQALAQVFPVYWLGLGTRSALLPDAMAAVEVSGAWRSGQTVGVLAAWAVVGLAVAPVVLRRMARKESGSSVGARRERAMQRVG
ncbi:ABC transporter permease [Streptomyces sp. NPDC127068]|uniref:ABC transporter permease n=1 Tax=Streptomyces sp. NPDC127068 TaxID=3347127 RepID=UPI003657B48B